MSNGKYNIAWSDNFVAGLAAAGLCHVVMAPGARSAPLALAFLRRAELACHVINDERAAGYFALGIAKVTRQPVAVLCTSGTATANLLPSVMEANLARIPMLVLTADRPAEALHWSGNQTVDQAKLYGNHVRAFYATPLPGPTTNINYLRALAARLFDECQTPLAGPIHVNLAFDEPLLPEIIPEPPALPQPISVFKQTADLSSPALLDALAARLSGRPGVIVCGEGRYSTTFPKVIATLAERLDVPILAEPLSGLRCGPHDQSRILTHQARFLRQDQLPLPDWVLRCGNFPVSRTLERWLKNLAPKVQHILLAPPGHCPDPLWQSHTIVHGDEQALLAALTPRVDSVPTDWCSAWQHAEREAASSAAVCCDASALFEGSVAAQLVRALPEHSHLFIGNSLAIRAIDSFSGKTNKPLQFHGNRGASGIDGNIATAAGIAAASKAQTALLIGDQTAMHDCSSLALMRSRNVVVVILDNGGGGIFDHLTFAKAIPEQLFSRGWRCPPAIDFPALAKTFGLNYAQAGDAENLRKALDTAFGDGGAWLIRVNIERIASNKLFAS